MDFGSIEAAVYWVKKNRKSASIRANLRPNLFTFNTPAKR